MTDRTPAPPFRSRFSAGLQVRARGKWLPAVLPCNLQQAGGAPQIVVDGEVAYIGYSTIANGFSRIHLRSFDTNVNQWIDGEPIDVTDRESLLLGAGFSLVGDGCGRLYCLYAAGGETAGSGVLRLAAAQTRDLARWTLATVADDPEVMKNLPAEHLALATGSREVIALHYSRRTDGFRSVHQRYVHAGAIVGPPRMIARADQEGAFSRISGFRGLSRGHLPMSILSGKGQTAAMVGARKRRRR